MRVLFPVEFLKLHGTEFPAWSPEESRRYTRLLARRHYENFPLVSLLAPRRLRQDYCNVYAFCRWADDLADETGDPERSLSLLSWWKSGLHAVGSGNEYHPVYVALRDTVARHSLPLSDFDDLLRAFVQDQSVSRYETYDDLLRYCRYSANPVGRMVLRLNGSCQDALLTMSDSICSALQLANHWQDVRRDWHNGRVYIPREVMRDHDYSPELLGADIARGGGSSNFRAVMRDLVGRASRLFESGLPLGSRFRGRLGFEIDLYARAGLAVLAKIRKQGYDTIAARPTLGVGETIGIALRTGARRLARTGSAT